MFALLEVVFSCIRECTYENWADHCFHLFRFIGIRFNIPFSSAGNNCVNYLEPDCVARMTCVEVGEFDSIGSAHLPFFSYETTKSQSIKLATYRELLWVLRLVVAHIKPLLRHFCFSLSWNPLYQWHFVRINKDM